jgi:hypothetical protein
MHLLSIWLSSVHIIFIRDTGNCTKTHIIKTVLPISLPGVKETPT